MSDVNDRFGSPSSKAFKRLFYKENWTIPSSFVGIIKEKMRKLSLASKIC